MKKTIYYVLLFVIWIATITVLASTLVISGFIPTSYGLGYAIGSACGYPQLWLIAAGIVMLVRPMLNKAIFKTCKIYKKTVAIILIAVGIVWIVINIGARLYHQSVEKVVMERLQENEEEIIDYVPGMFDEK